MSLPRRPQENPSEISPFKQSGEFVPQFPTQALNRLEKERLQNLGNTALEIICMNAGLPLDTKEEVQQELARLSQLNSQAQTEFDENYDGYLDFRENILKPEEEIIKNQLQIKLGPKWRVSGLDYLDQAFVMLKKEGTNTELTMYQDSFQVTTGEQTIAWMHDLDDNSINITFQQFVEELDQPNPLVTMSSNPHDQSLGIITLHHALDADREDLPDFIDLIDPNVSLSKVIYGKNGELQYAKIIVAQKPGEGLIPHGKRTEVPRSMIYVYDLREGVTDNLPPAYVHLEGETEPLKVQTYPQLTIKGNTLIVEHNSIKNFFPTKIEGGYLKMANNCVEALRDLFPPRGGRIPFVLAED